MPISFTQFTKNVEKLNDSSQLKMLESAVIDTEEDAIALNHEQLYDGKKSTGRKLRKYKNKPYEAKKARLNPGKPTNAADLYLPNGETSGFFSGFEFEDVRRTSGEVIATIESDDYKADWLVYGTSRMQPFGEDVYGLTTSNSNKYLKENVKPIFVNLLKKATLKRG